MTCKVLERKATPNHVSLIKAVRTGYKHPCLMAPASEKVLHLSILNSKLVTMADPLASNMEDLRATCPVSSAFCLILASSYPFLASSSFHESLVFSTLRARGSVRWNCTFEQASLRFPPKPRRYLHIVPLAFLPKSQFWDVSYVSFVYGMTFCFCYGFER